MKGVIFLKQYFKTNADRTGKIEYLIVDHEEKTLNANYSQSFYANNYIVISKRIMNDLCDDFLKNGYYPTNYYK